MGAECLNKSSMKERLVCQPVWQQAASHLVEPTMKAGVDL